MYLIAFIDKDEEEIKSGHDGSCHVDVLLEGRREDRKEDDGGERREEEERGGGRRRREKGWRREG